MTNSIDLNQIPKMQENIISRENQDGTIVLMKPDDLDLFYKIDGVAASVWKQLQTDSNLEQIIQDLSKQYDVSTKQIEDDINSFFNDLKKFEIIE